MKKFEERLERLEAIAEEIRDSGIGLDQALSLFDEGIKLSKGLEKDLEKIEGRIEILLNKPAEPDETAELGLFDSVDE
jgi:exodeoxyribonuclease VII small subunit